MSNKRYSKEFKTDVLLAFDKREFTVQELCVRFGISEESLRRWAKLYERYGSEGLQRSTTWKPYSKALKEAAVKDAISGTFSQSEVIEKYEISSKSVLEKWINHYTSHRELKDTSKGRTSSMTKGRKTTWDERVQIVLDCLKNGKDYQKAASTHQVSYQQVYQWVKKYENGGDEALKDKRGHKKEEDQLTPEEKANLRMKALERENDRLRAELLFIKKVRRDRKEAKISQIRFEDKYLAIQSLYQEKGLSISLLCDIAGIARSAYYKWLNRTPSFRERLNQKITKEIKALYQKVEGIFGYRQMTLHMNRTFEETLNHKRIYRLMKLAGLRSVIRVKKKRYKPSAPQHVADNVLNREFTAEKPNEKWVTDVTEFKYGQSKKAYLSVIRDLYDGSIVSYVLGHSNNNQLIFETLDQAIVRLHQDHPMIHSDRGFQYTSKKFKRKLEAAGMTQSMSRVGRCIDNGPMESFFGTLKCEKYYLHKYQTFEELNIAINEYIYFYNHERYQKRLNGLSPIEYRAKAA